jgi:hypothetical protein
MTERLNLLDRRPGSQCPSSPDPPVMKSSSLDGNTQFDLRHELTLLPGRPGFAVDLEASTENETFFRTRLSFGDGRLLHFSIMSLKIRAIGRSARAPICFFAW